MRTGLTPRDLHPSQGDPQPAGFKMVASRGVEVAVHCRFTIEKEPWLNMQIGGSTVGFPMHRLDHLLKKLIDIIEQRDGHASHNLMDGNTTMTFFGARFGDASRGVAIMVSPHTARLSIEQARDLVEGLRLFAFEIVAYCQHRNWLPPALRRQQLALVATT